MKTFYQYTDTTLHLHHQLDDHPKDEDFAMHVHDNYEIMYFVQGTGKYLVEGSVYPLTPGSILLMRPTESHRIKILADVPYERYVIYFYPELMKPADPEGLLLEAFHKYPLGHGNLYLPHEFKEENPIDLIESMCISHKDEQERRLAITTHLFPLLGSIRKAFLQKKEQDRPDSGQGQAEKIIHYVNRHLTDDLSVEVLASRFFLSPSQFSRLFKQATGSSVWAYITIKRLMLARNQIRNGMHPTQACLACGFRDYSAFYRAYTARFRKTPKQDLPNNV